MIPYKPPGYLEKGFNCPFCGAFADQVWYRTGIYGLENGQYYGIINGYILGNCRHCNKYTVWILDKLAFPQTGTAPLPNPDMPEDVKQDYEEARNIVTISPRGSAALLRLAIQKLCKSLGESGKDLNDDIKKLVAKGLPEKLQKALDSVRVIGNNAVHPGQIDLTDDIETANKLFVFVNVIVDNRIT